jgi:hypothetical protein
VFLLGGYLPHLAILAGIVTMGFAGLRYWVSDPLRFLLTPPWERWIRHLFIAPGYQIYLAGSALALLGPVMLVLRWLAARGTLR